jgi:hypothetical protein
LLRILLIGFYGCSVNNRCSCLVFIDSKKEKNLVPLLSFDRSLIFSVLCLVFGALFFFFLLCFCFLNSCFSVSGAAYDSPSCVGTVSIKRGFFQQREDLVLPWRPNFSRQFKRRVFFAASADPDETR